MADARTLIRPIILIAAIAVAGCATIRQTDPPQTATQQLLVSTAIDRSAAKLKLALSPGSRIFVDAQHVDADENIQYPKYTIAAVREQLLRQGLRLVGDRVTADAIVELRSGAQSINEKKILLGIPEMALPVPFTGPVTIPELAIFKYHRLNGVAKLALAAYRPDGTLLFATDFQYGEAEQKDWTLLFFISHKSHDLWPGER